MDFGPENLSLYQQSECFFNALLKVKMTFAAAESCTGGLMSHLVTRIPGSSAVFWGSVVCYSNEAKQNILGVPAALIQKYGAVSGEVAQSMLKGIMALSSADLGVAITGIAGPGGGTPEKPVGLVWIAVQKKGLTPNVRRFLFKGDRHGIQAQAAQSAMSLVLESLNQ